MKKTNTEIAERLKIVRDRLGMTQIELSEILGISDNAYSMIENGKRSLQGKYINILEEEFRVNRKYLERGEGEPLLRPSDSEIVELFNLLSEPRKEAVLAFIKSMVNE